MTRTGPISNSPAVTARMRYSRLTVGRPPSDDHPLPPLRGVSAKADMSGSRGSESKSSTPATSTTNRKSLPTQVCSTLRDACASMVGASPVTTRVTGSVSKVSSPTLNFSGPISWVPGADATSWKTIESSLHMLPPQVAKSEKSGRSGHARRKSAGVKSTINSNSSITCTSVRSRRARTVTASGSGTVTTSVTGSVCSFRPSALNSKGPISNDPAKLATNE